MTSTAATTAAPTPPAPGTGGGLPPALPGGTAATPANPNSTATTTTTAFVPPTTEPTFPTIPAPSDCSTGGGPTQAPGQKDAMGGGPLDGGALAPVLQQLQAVIGQLSTAVGGVAGGGAPGKTPEQGAPTQGGGPAQGTVAGANGTPAADAAAGADKVQGGGGTGDMSAIVDALKGLIETLSALITAIGGVAGGGPGQKDPGQMPPGKGEPGQKPPKGDVGGNDGPGQKDPGQKPPKGDVGGNGGPGQKDPGQKPPKGDVGGQDGPGQKPPKGDVGGQDGPGQKDPGQKPPTGDVDGDSGPGQEPPKGGVDGDSGDVVQQFPPDVDGDSGDVVQQFPPDVDGDSGIVVPPSPPQEPTQDPTQDPGQDPTQEPPVTPPNGGGPKPPTVQKGNVVLTNRDGHYSAKLTARGGKSEHSVELWGDPHVVIKNGGKTQKFDVGYGAAKVKLFDGTVVRWNTDTKHRLKDFVINSPGTKFDQSVTTADGKNEINLPTALSDRHLKELAKALKAMEGPFNKPNKQANWVSPAFKNGNANGGGNNSNPAQQGARIVQTSRKK